MPNALKAFLMHAAQGGFDPVGSYYQGQRVGQQEAFQKRKLDIEASRYKDESGQRAISNKLRERGLDIGEGKLMQEAANYGQRERLFQDRLAALDRKVLSEIVNKAPDIQTGSRIRELYFNGTDLPGKPGGQMDPATADLPELYRDYPIQGQHLSGMDAVQHEMPQLQQQGLQRKQSAALELQRGKTAITSNASMGRWNAQQAARGEDKKKQAQSKRDAATQTGFQKKAQELQKRKDAAERMHQAALQSGDDKAINFSKQIYTQRMQQLAQEEQQLNHSQTEFGARQSLPDSGITPDHNQLLDQLLQGGQK